MTAVDAMPALRDYLPKHWTLHAAGAATAVVVTLVFYKGLYASLRADIDDSSQRIAMVQSLAAGAERVTASHDQMLKRLDQLAAVARDARTRMPTDVSASEFLAQSARLAEALGVVIDGCQMGVAQLFPTHATIDVACRLTGSYASICQYLAAIDQLPQIVRIKQLELGRSAESGAYPAQVTFQLYYQLQPHDKDNRRGSP